MTIEKNHSELFNKKILRNDIIEYLILGLGLFCISLTAIYNYLLFHSIAELFSIIISGCIFIIGWNANKYMEGSSFLILGTSYLFIGILDLLHTLSYDGMGVFVDYDTNLPTSLWICARYIQSISIIFAIISKNKKLNPKLILLSYAVITSILLFLIFQGIFPTCYIEEDKSLTLFKIVSEYIIDIILLIALILLFIFWNEFNKRINKRILYFLVFSIIATMISEIAFTFYIEVYDFSNFLGHLLKIMAAFFVYKAIIETGFENPFNLLFRKLKLSERNLIKKANDLEEAYVEFDQIFNASLPMRVIDNENNIIRVNDTYTQFFEVKKEELLGKKCYEVSPGHVCNTKKCSFQKIKSGENYSEYEVNRILPSGKRVIYLIYTLPWKDSGGNVLGMIQTFTDITKRKLAESRLESFISTASHELRTPTTVLLQSTELLNKYKDKISEEQKTELIDSITRNTTILVELIDDLLTISKIDEKKIKLKKEKFDPIKLMHNIIKAMELRIQSKNNIISVKHDNNVILYGDIHKFNQIFRILIDNGLKYSKNNTKFKIKIINNYVGKFNPNNLDGVLFKFKDHGLGMDKKDLANLFERFYRSERVNHIPGTGLGLAIAKEYIELHGGNIFVESELDKGSIFSIFIPRKKT